MGTDRNILYKAADALNRATAAIGSFIDSEAAVSGLEYLEDLLLELKDKLPKVCSFLNDDWRQIEGNEARLNEISMFRKDYDNFRESAIRLDNWRIDNIGSDIMDLDGAEIGMDYVLLVGEFDKRFAFFFSHIKGTTESIKTSEKKSLKGLAKRLSRYIYGIEDHSLERAILHNDFPIFRGSWIGQKNEATYFGKHFRLSCEQMNMLFYFYGKNQKHIKLHYSRNDDDKIMESDEIAMILSEFRI